MTADLYLWATPGSHAPLSNLKIWVLLENLDRHNRGSGIYDRPLSQATNS
jgi:hypothetical protein